MTFFHTHKQTQLNYTDNELFLHVEKIIIVFKVNFFGYSEYHCIFAATIHLINHYQLIQDLERSSPTH